MKLNKLQTLFKITKTSGKQFQRTYSNQVKRTCLYDFHVAHSGRMVEFAGHDMAVSYGSESAIASHLHVRNSVGLFDISHMMQLKIHGRDRARFIDKLVVSDIPELPQNKGTLTVLTTENGGIIDDLIVTNTDKDYLFVVCNAGCAEKDFAHLQASLAKFKSSGGDAQIERLNGMGLVALQGPKTVDVLSLLLPQKNQDLLSRLTFMSTAETSLGGIDVRLTRCGYTGEDGVEISVDPARATQLCQLFLESKAVKLAGLGVRDSLRLEAGLCLYGNDIDDTTSPVEAGLTFTIGKRSRQSADFPGANVILNQLRDKPTRRRVGFVSSGRPVRGGAVINDLNGNQIGAVTSGCPSPSLKTNISMGYVTLDNAKAGTKVKFAVGKQTIDGVVSKMPFVKTNYFNPK